MHLDCGVMDELRKHIMAEHHFQLQCSGDLLHGLCRMYEEFLICEAAERTDSEAK